MGQLMWFTDDRLRKDRWMFIANVMGALFNVGWALAFSDGYFAWLNWFAGGFCLCMALTQVTLSKLRLLVEDQTNTIIAQSAALESMSPAQMETMLRGAVAQLQREGVLPKDVDVGIMQDNLPKSLH